MRKQELVFGIYTPLQWHEFSKPEFRCPCGLRNKQFNAEYQKWWQEKQKLLNKKSKG